MCRYWNLFRIPWGKLKMIKMYPWDIRSNTHCNKNMPWHLTRHWSITWYLTCNMTSKNKHLWQNVCGDIWHGIQYDIWLSNWYDILSDIRYEFDIPNIWYEFWHDIHNTADMVMEISSDMTSISHQIWYGIRYDIWHDIIFRI